MLELDRSADRTVLSACGGYYKQESQSYCMQVCIQADL